MAATRPANVSGAPPEKPAGARSGAGTNYLDANLPFAGVVGDTLRKPAATLRPATRGMTHGDGGEAEVATREKQDFRKTGTMPTRHTAHRLAAVPGYAGHIEGKIAENVHGHTFRHENEHTNKTLDHRTMRRATSASATIYSPIPPHAVTAESSRAAERRFGATNGINNKGPNVASYVPGYMVHMPGKLSETVHAHSTGEVSFKSQAYRRTNPHVNCEGWVRKGVWPSDRRPTYKFTTRFEGADAQDLFSRVQEEDFAADNVRLGHVFGLHAKMPVTFAAGDRYIHYKNLKQASGGRKDSSEMTPAGQPTHSIKLEAERWKKHNTLSLKNGNQRNAY